MALFSSGIEYGIHSLMLLTDSKGTLRDMSVRDLAELQGVPYDYLGKIFTKLSKANLVKSTEGKGGGFRLARSPEHITILDITEAIDGKKRIFECKEIRQNMALFEQGVPQWACSGVCGVHRVMNVAQERMEAALAQQTILDLTRQTARKAPDEFEIDVQEWVTSRR